MMFKQREIYQFKCCNEGRLITQTRDKNNELVYINQDNFNTGGKATHFFIILSLSEYNNIEHNQYISVLPITSSKGNYTTQEYGLTICPEDIKLGHEFIGDNILCDRPLRILKKYLSTTSCRDEILEGAYNKIIAKIVYHFGCIGVLNEEFKKEVIKKQ